MTDSPDDELRRRVEGEMRVAANCLPICSEPPLHNPELMSWHAAVEVALGHARRKQEAVKALRNLVEEIENDGGVDTSEWRLLDEARAVLARCTSQPTRTCPIVGCDLPEEHLHRIGGPDEPTRTTGERT